MKLEDKIKEIVGQHLDWEAPGMDDTDEFINELFSLIYKHLEKRVKARFERKFLGFAIPDTKDGRFILGLMLSEIKQILKEELLK